MPNEVGKSKISPLIRRAIRNRMLNGEVGGILLKQSKYDRVLTFSSFILAATIIGLLLYGKYVGTVTIHGYVTTSGHITSINSDMDGFVESLQLRTGAPIKKGDIEFTLKTDEKPPREIVVRSKQSGTIITVNISTGQRLSAGTAIAVISLNRITPQISIFAPSRLYRFIKINNKVKIRIDAYPYQIFGEYSGTISDIGSTPVSPPKFLGYESNASWYRVDLTLDDDQAKTQVLREGMLADVSIVTERVSLFDSFTF
ncbi:HlyD family efflux transporter periplasmic adaptor subunit [Paraburkholderia tropica]|uniref:HlyD family efflux transporter periplasmic adaptor subunit n=1 Tax=Paraburkholderia tropica TaxID=92647 RepID=UPI002AB79CE1|nr:HlyD family efflux transporter periplasmic adaptor subunit [Paraburkholderia tropica]